MREMVKERGVQIKEGKWTGKKARTNKKRWKEREEEKRKKRNKDIMNRGKGRRKWKNREK